MEPRSKEAIATIHATIVSIGEMTQYEFTDRKTGKDAIGSKFKFEYKKTDSSEIKEAEASRGRRQYIEVGNTYELELKARQMDNGGWFTPSVNKNPVLITEQAVNGMAPPPPEVPTSNSYEQIAQKEQPNGIATTAPAVGQPETGLLKRVPEFNSRWLQFSTHVRTAEMQATERVGHYIELLIAGKLITEGDEAIKQVKKTTVESWYTTEVEAYWARVLARSTTDPFGSLKDVS